MNIENIKETNFTKDVNNLPMTSDDNVLNKLDGFYDDTRLLGIELTLKKLSESKIAYRDDIIANGSVAPVANTYARITSVTVSSEIAKRWLIFAVFDNGSHADTVLTSLVESNGTQIGKQIRYNGFNGGGGTFAFTTTVSSGTRTYDFETYTDNTSVGNLRVDVRMVPLGG